METEIAYDFGKIRTVNGYSRGENPVNSTSGGKKTRQMATINDF